MSEKTSEIIPKRIFIVPYRNRTQHKFFFCKYMSFILEDKDDYEILISHQCDARTFNRGAVKNIGFIAAKNKYPNHYKDITFIFNDVDTIPFHKIFDYETTHEVVKHYYGFKCTLGGIVVIKGSDFEKINGFPCFWGWGMEDKVLQQRCDQAKLKTDRSVFYNIGSPEILQLFDGISRIISKKDSWRGENDNGIDGLTTISNLRYKIDDKSDNQNDNIFTIHNEKIKIINIKTFSTYISFGSQEYYNYDLREPKRKIINPDKNKEITKTVTTTQDWSNIPHYPTIREKRENLVQYLISNGKSIPEILIKQIQQDKKNEINEDSYNNFSNHNFKEKNENMLDSLHENPEQNKILYMNKNNQHISQIPNSQNYDNFKPPHKYSYQYARYIGVKPTAQSSARLKLGGIY